jgi:hypothetical protein
MYNKFQHIIIVAVLLFFPKINYSQAPNLGTASSFVLFTADGAFNNFGASNVTGDIGTNLGAFTGFPPGVVDGQIHVVDATSLQAATDVFTAYDFLTGVACDTTIGLILGNNQILTPHVYCLGGAATTLNDTLFLDAQGDANALFIFKIDAALSTSKFSNVILINSATPENVYWQINGALEVADSAIFRGTILTNGAINLLLNSTLEGRGLSKAGAINTYTINATLLSPSTLPIGLLYFSGLNEQSYNSFSWSTSTEINNDYFTLEKTTDALNFIAIEKTNGAGNSNTLLYYSIIDYYPTEGLSYYRLKQTDFDGKYTYSKLVAIDVSSQLTEDFSIYPNPFSTSATIVINDVSQFNKVELRIYNVLGEEMMITNITKQITTFDTRSLSTGIYFYQLTDNNKTIQSGKLIARQ